jgi:hypothetical protein
VYFKRVGLKAVMYPEMPVIEGITLDGNNLL